MRVFKEDAKNPPLRDSSVCLLGSLPYRQYDNRTSEASGPFRAQGLRAKSPGHHAIDHEPQVHRVGWEILEIFRGTDREELPR
jgi:hypothetical protein